MAVDSYKLALQAWLNAILGETGLTPAALAERAGVSPTTLTRFLNNPDHAHALSGRTVARIVEATGKPAPPFSGASDESPAEFRQDLGPGGPIGARVRGARAADVVFAPEFPRTQYDPGAGDELALWPFDRAALRAMQVPVHQLAVYTQGDESMTPTIQPGDKVLVDRSDRRTGTSGLFAIWDGENVIFRRVARALGPRDAPPRLKLSADNRLFDDVEADADWVDAIGRVILIVRKV